METKVKKNYKKPNSLSHGVKIKIDNLDLITSTDKGINITGITANGILYIPITQFASKYNVSYSTISRNIEKMRYHRESSKYFIKIGNKNYVSCGIIASRKKHTGKFANEDYAQWLSCFHWDMIGSVRYDNLYSELAAKKIMDKLYKRVSRRYYDKELVFFYVSEPNPDGQGWHNHFLLGYQNDINHTEIKSLMENNLRAGKLENKCVTKIEPYKAHEYFIDYVVKFIHVAKDGYDFKSNHY